MISLEGSLVLAPKIICMKKLVSMAIIVSFCLVACKKSAIEASQQPVEDLMSRASIDVFIKSKLSEHKKFEWSMGSDQLVWSALQHTDQIMSVGYQPEGMGNIDDRLHLINVHDKEWLNAKNKLLQLILASEQQLDKTITLNQLIPWEEQFLPVINITVNNPATVKLLRAHKMVRYAEPMGYEPEDAFNAANNNQSNALANSSGCGSNTPTTGLMVNIDYAAISPNSKQSWNHSFHKISNAWTKSTGAGTKVFIIDTGCEFDQENLGSAFNQGASAGRTVEKIVTLPRATFLGIPTGPIEIADDGCGHGTSMAGACAAPRGTDGNACGVAYNCNLVSCRAAEDVFLESSREAKGVSDAFTNAGNRADVKIISMSMGRITSSSQIRDAINYAYGKGKLIFCAAGTSFSWTSGWYGVIFPATLSNVNAVTGVKDINFNTTCDDCHDGSETDFTIVMEKAVTGRFPLTTAMSGDVPSTVGGSSVATATAAGIAALVWSRFPRFTRDQVLNKLIQTSSNYPNRNAYLGWGNLNADAGTN
jgi:subtilisin family serine protease